MVILFLVKFYKISNDFVIYVVMVTLRRNIFDYFHIFVSHADIRIIKMLFANLLFFHSCLSYMEGNLRVLIGFRLDL